MHMFGTIYEGAINEYDFAKYEWSLFIKRKWVYLQAKIVVYDDY
jgi:hypothetical protein